MVRWRLRGLERKLVFQRAEDLVARRVQQLIEDWERATHREEPCPDPRDFVNHLIDDGVYLPTFPRVINYLELCRGSADTPDPRRLRRMLLPWYRL